MPVYDQKNCVALSVFAKEVPMAVKQLLLGLFIKLYLIKCNEKLLKTACSLDNDTLHWVN